MDLTRVLLAAVLTVPLGFVIAILVRKGRILRRKELIREAERNGRVATARKLWEKVQAGDPASKQPDLREKAYMAQYLYFAEGRQYACGARNRADPGAPRWSSRPPETLRVYWPAGHPERAIYTAEQPSDLDGAVSALTMVAVFLLLYRLL